MGGHQASAVREHNGGDHTSGTNTKRGVSTYEAYIGAGRALIGPITCPKPGRPVGKCTCNVSTAASSHTTSGEPCTPASVWTDKTCLSNNSTVSPVIVCIMNMHKNLVDVDIRRQNRIKSGWQRAHSTLRRLYVAVVYRHCNIALRMWRSWYGL